MDYVVVAIIAAIIIYVLRRFGAKSGQSNDLDNTD